MSEEGLEYGERTHTYNSRLAQELAVAGDAAGVTDALHDALYHAYFVENVNLAVPEALLEIADRVGLPPAVAREAVEERAHRAEVDEHWSRAIDSGVSGVPTFAAGGFSVVGAQPYAVLENLMEHVGTSRRGTGEPAG